MGIFTKPETKTYYYETRDGHYICQRTITKEVGRKCDETRFSPFTPELKKKIEGETGHPLQKGRIRSSYKRRGYKK